MFQDFLFQVTMLTELTILFHIKQHKRNFLYSM
jgi:hypothetical protein